MRILITAGPTREPIDPVRFISNRSSGKMGYALAEAALAAGHEVVLVSGPVALSPPEGAELVRVESAAEMFAEVESRIGACEAAIFTAAVADYTPQQVSGQKIKKGAGSRMTLELVATRDILGSARGGFGFGGLLVGFAAETDQLRRHALAKLRDKGCDFLVANDVSRSDIGFDGDHNEVTVFGADGSGREIPKGTKRQVAGAILDLIGLGSRASEGQV